MQTIDAEQVLGELADIAFADPDTQPVKIADKLRALELLYKYLGLGEKAGAAEGVVIVEE